MVMVLAQNIGLKRAGARFANVSAAEDRFERMGSDFHQRLRQGFIDIARENPERCKIIDADSDIDTVSERMISAVSSRLSAQGIG